jgi:hypothetical protein
MKKRQSRSRQARKLELRSSSSRSRKATAVGVIAALGSMSSAAAASASAYEAPVPSTPTPNLPTATPDGWIDYHNVGPSVSASAVQGPIQVRSGQRTPDGKCHLTSSGTLAAGAPSFSEIEVGYNPLTCEDKVVTIQNPASSALGGQPTTPGSVAAQSSFKNNFHTKTSWIDPLNITITSLADNLGWNTSACKNCAAQVSSVGGYNFGYEFSWDNWSDSGTPPFVAQPTDKNGNVSLPANQVWSDASETFQNTDFERYLVLALGFAALALCGWDTSAAVFDHYLETKGNADGSATWSTNDSRQGGCSNLVDHRNDINWGWAN